MFNKYSCKHKWCFDDLVHEIDMLTFSGTSDGIAQLNIDLIGVCDGLIFKDGLLKHIIEAYKNFSKDPINSSSKFVVLCKKLNWHTLYKKQFISALKIVIDSKVAEICDNDEYEESDGDNDSETSGDHLLKLKTWCLDNLFIFVRFLDYDAMVNQFLWEYSLDRFANKRLQSLFELILEFPDSQPSIEELKVSLVASGNIGFAGRMFRGVLQKRLLHVGASTSQILDYYIVMVKALRILDPTGLLLDFAAAPVRQYLKGRKDAIRCIVTSLIADSGTSDLQGELKQGGSLMYGVDEDDEEDGPGVEWSPQRTNNDLRGGATIEQSSRGQDILSLLVSIYGSTDLFIVEFRALLADRLFMNFKFAVDQELANLELLKIRFGEDCLHSCEVMIKDVEDSKRLNHAVFAKKRKSIVVDSEKNTKFVDTESVSFTIISENYWPQVACDADMTLHSEISNQITAFCEDYAEMKKPRKLYPVKGAGTVQLELHFDDGAMRNFSVSLFQANVIAHLGDHSPLMLSKLLSLCGEVVEESDVLQSMTFWIQRGVVREAALGTDGDRCFYVVEDQLTLAALDGNTTCNDEDTQQTFRMNAAASAQQKASLVAIEEFVRGMLNSHGPMDLERVSTMLRMMVGASSGSDTRFDMNLVELRQYLQGLVEQAKIDIVDSLYVIRK